MTGLLLEKGAKSQDAALLEALQYGLLDGLDDASTESVDQSIHRAWFGARHGGYTWQIFARDAGPNQNMLHRRLSEPLTPQQKRDEDTVLATLNTAQANHDEAVRTLADMQWKLFAIWWLNNSDDLPDDYADAFADALDVNEDNVAGQVKSLRDDIAKRRAPNSDHPEPIPWPNPHQTLDQAADAYLKAHGIDVTKRQLKRTPLGEFHHPCDPVVLLYGMKAPEAPDLSAPLTCRLSEAIVTGIDLGKGIVDVPAKIPVPSMGKVPKLDIIQKILGELWLFDQAYTAKTLPDVIKDPKNKVKGTLPKYGTLPWSQPWSPLYMLYEVYHYPISYEKNNESNWTFDGTRYHWNGTGTANPPEYQSHLGRIYLTPHATFNLSAQVRRYSETHPGVLTDELKKLEKTVAKWDLLSQSLDGLTTRLSLRNPAVAAHPYEQKATADSLSTLIGNQYQTIPMPGKAPKDGNWQPSSYLQTRTGQFFFNLLYIVDRFGQVCDAINSRTSAQKRIARPDSVKPDKTVMSSYPDRYVELRPRIFQGARFQFECVSPNDDDENLNLNANVNPVCAWLLPNHLDKGLSTYDSTGTALGETRVSYDGTVIWEAAPYSKYKTIDALRVDFPHLANFLAQFMRDGSIANKADAFNQLLKTIDETLYTINPLGGWDDPTMTVLAGRPLAMIRTRLSFELDGPTLMDPSWEQWQYVVALKKDPPKPDLLNYSWGVRLGSAWNLDDGLIGYFVGNDYAKLFAVHTEGITSPYIKPIGSGLDLTIAGEPDEEYLTLIADPRAAVHAITDILPVSVLQLPSKFLDSALARMEVSFRMGPVLASATTVADSDRTVTTKLTMPRPSTRYGSWMWAEPTKDDKWITIPLAAASPAAQVPTTPAAAHTGRMLRSGGVKKTDQD